jgi:hypothetical protein
VDQGVPRCRLGVMGEWMVVTLKKYIGVVNSAG